MHHQILGSAPLPLDHKENGVRHVNCALYHPSLYRLAKNFVRAFMQLMKAGEKSGILSQWRLDNFISGYRSTPHATMQRNLAVLFLGRDRHTHMDFLKPNRKEQVSMHQDAQTRHHNQHAKPYMFEVSQSDIARNLGSGSKWMPGVVNRIQGPLSYVIEMDTGVQWKLHMDHILPAGSSKDTPVEYLVRNDWSDFPAPQDPTAPEVTPESTQKPHWKMHFLGI